MGESTAVERLGTFASELRFEQVPSEVREHLKLLLLHNLSVGLLGQEPVQPLIKATVPSPSDSGQGASILGARGKVSAADAAFANGVLIHAQTWDDSMRAASTHLGCTVVAAALAACQAHNRSGERLLTALAAGYEVAGAVGTVGLAFTAPRGLRGTCLYGPLAAAAAVANLMGLNAEQATHAIALAAGCTGGYNQMWVDGSAEWRLQVGSAARLGIVAAQFAAAGATGARHALEGSAGFFQVHAGDSGLGERCGRELGLTWHSLTATVKTYPICAILQNPASAAISLLHAGEFSVEDITRVDLYLNPRDAKYAGTDCSGPFADVGATLMSAQFCVAVALTHGVVRPEHLSEFTNPAYQRLWPLINIIGEPTFAQSSCRVELFTRDGRVRKAATDAKMQLDGLTIASESGFVRHHLGQGILPADRVEHLIGSCLRLEELKGIDLLFAACELD